MNAFIYKYTIQHAHPAKFVAEILGIIWSVYFLWRHNWIATIVVGIIFFLLSTLLLWKRQIDLAKLETTALGKVVSVYTKPLNFVVYNASAIPVAYGLWMHDFIPILVGITILFLPQLWEWK